MKGYLYPYRISTTGKPVETEDSVELVASAVTQFLSQQAGERAYQPRNGNTAQTYIFENESELVKANIRREIAFGLTRSEPRITVVEVLVRYVTQGPGRRLELTVLWSYRNQLFSTSRGISAG